MSLDRRTFIVSSAGLILSTANSQVYGKFVRNDSTNEQGATIPFLSCIGDMHVHSQFSSGKQFGQLDADHLQAQSVQQLVDMQENGSWLMVITDHGEKMTQSNWKRIEYLVNHAKSGYKVPVYRGCEWTLGGAINNPTACHVTIMCTDRYVATHAAPVDFGGDIVTSYHDLWGWLNTNLGKSGMWGFPHPWIGEYQFDDFALASQLIVRDRCCWIEVCGGPTRRSIEDGIPFLVSAVEKGWHVGPVMGGDNFGDATYYSTPATSVSMCERISGTDFVLPYILRRRLSVTDVYNPRFTWSMMKKGIPQSEVLLGGTYDARRYGFPDTVDFMINQDYYPRLARWEMYFVGGKHPFAQGRAPDEPPGIILKYQEKASSRPTAVIFCLILADGERILGAPIWINY
ncbi:hypothetical protein COS66_01500 [Candidatus Berkelbacteria bacterium CG06_land_8_20_14_3_00_43_10]|nr:MAG: hypothetical protein AUK41_03650 [Candidatus Berkelbacteria bacterium CG2_30_43_20]PIU87331.1 MAG: hypothetical protein COS66_01500 [Candidatus Berkelbacteria bacterium CG06_land_8_20_14_3_00_43_10]